MLKLHGEYIRGAIDELYGGSISRLAAALSLEPRPDRSTVTRWLSSDGSHFPRDEERILALQIKKRSLSDVALGEANQAMAITRDELLALLD